MFESRDLTAAHTSAYLRILNEFGCSPAAVTQLTQRQFPHAGVPEIVNCRYASYVTSSDRRKLHRMCNLHFAAWLQGNAQVTISGTPA